MIDCLDGDISWAKSYQPSDSQTIAVCWQLLEFTGELVIILENKGVQSIPDKFDGQCLPKDSWAIDSL